MLASVFVIGIVVLGLVWCTSLVSPRNVGTVALEFLANCTRASPARMMVAITLQVIPTPRRGNFDIDSTVVIDGCLPDSG